MCKQDKSLRAKVKSKSRDSANINLSTCRLKQRYYEWINIWIIKRES